MTSDGMAAWMVLEGDNRFDDVPPPTNDMEDLLAMTVDAEDDWDI